jgi:short-subunit dehydrogenase
MNCTAPVLTYVIQIDVSNTQGNVVLIASFFNFLTEWLLNNYVTVKCLVLFFC